jgi:hypothetical protein
VFGSGALGRCGVCGEDGDCGGNGWAAAGGGFAVDDFVEAAMLEEDVLAGSEAVGGLREGVGDLERGGVGAGVVDASVAVGGDPEAEVVLAGGVEGKAEVGGEDDVLRLDGGMELNGAAVEREEEGLARAGVEEVELAGGADQDLAAASEVDGGGVSVGGDGGVGEQADGVALDF